MASGMFDDDTLAELTDAWDAIVGDIPASYSRPAAMENGRLTIVCDTFCCAGELALSTSELIAAIAKHVPEATISSIRIRCDDFVALTEMYQ